VVAYIESGPSGLSQGPHCDMLGKKFKFHESSNRLKKSGRGNTCIKWNVSGCYCAQAAGVVLFNLAFAA